MCFFCVISSSVSSVISFATTFVVSFVIFFVTCCSLHFLISFYQDTQNKRPAHSNSSFFIVLVSGSCFWQDRNLGLGHLFCHFFFRATSRGLGYTTLLLLEGGISVHHSYVGEVFSVRFMRIGSSRPHPRAARYAAAEMNPCVGCHPAPGYV
jgi:hypothetical protein